MPKCPVETGASSLMLRRHCSSF